MNMEVSLFHHHVIEGIGINVECDIQEVAFNEKGNYMFVSYKCRHCGTHLAIQYNYPKISYKDTVETLGE